MMASHADWDADAYRRVAAPQLEWGRSLLARVPWSGGEQVVDVGCGDGRLTRELLACVPRGRLIAVDRSARMAALAHRELVGTQAGRVLVALADATALPIAGWADVVFSGATFHWVLDHPALFASIYSALRARGVLIAQCGGAGNLSRFASRASALSRSPEFATWFVGWSYPTLYADAGVTAERLQAAGFEEIETSLTIAPTRFADAHAYRDFIATVVARQYLLQLPESHRTAFLDALVDAAAADTPPFELDYVRLNIRARRPATAPQG